MSTNFGTPRLNSRKSGTYRFGLFAVGADLSVASTVRQLESLGYSHAATPASSDIQALVFARQAAHLTDAVTGVVVAAECVVGLHIARQACSGAVPVFDPDSMAFKTALRLVAPSTPPATTPAQPRRHTVRVRRAVTLGTTRDTIG